MAALSTLWVGLFPSIVASDAVGGAATGCMPELVINNATIIGCGRSASVCPWHHMTVRGRGTVENQNGASSPGHFSGMQ